MKFTFCGGFDAPDWLLSEIATLSNISSVRVKLLCNEIILKLHGKQINYSKIDRLTSDIIEFSSSDIKAILSALHFILANAIRNAVDAEVLSAELQQLGLPKESANAIKRSYVKNQRSLFDSICNEQILSLTTVDCAHMEWNIDYILSSSILENVNSSLIRLQLPVISDQSNGNKHRNESGDGKVLNVNMTADTLDSLLHELKCVQNMINDLSK